MLPTVKIEGKSAVMALGGLQGELSHTPLLVNCRTQQKEEDTSATQNILATLLLGRGEKSFWFPQQ